MPSSSPSCSIARSFARMTSVFAAAASSRSNGAVCFWTRAIPLL